MIQYNKEPHRVNFLIYYLIFVVNYRQKVFIVKIDLIGDIKHKIIELSESHDVEMLEIEWGDAFWSRSYFIATKGNASIDVLKQYVEEQRGV